MIFEVEQKFPISDFALLESRLLALDAQAKEPAEQVDTYFTHPARDFGTTDEALRIRSIDERNLITYKGPRIDTTTKTRHEIELALPDGKHQACEYETLLKALGFHPVRKVRKIRHAFQLQWEGREVEAALDEVDELGCFCELEFSATADDLEATQNALASLVAKLELGASERRSYLELLLAK
ncbi:MAG: class IV adenylate cyclase [Planctomycetales bacterium]|nr:class IV adenylate cyclase [Planctomycetales bacterium]